MLSQTNFLIISLLLSEIVDFWLKRDVLCESSRKCFTTTEKHSLAVCGSMLAKKVLFLIFVHIYWFDQKQLFKQILILLRIYPFKHVKKNKLSEYFIAPFWDSHFLTKKRSSLWISPKMLQTTEKHSLAICG